MNRAASGKQLQKRGARIVASANALTLNPGLLALIASTSKGRQTLQDAQKELQQHIESLRSIARELSAAEAKITGALEKPYQVQA